MDGIWGTIGTLIAATGEKIVLPDEPIILYPTLAVGLLFFGYSMINQRRYLSNSRKINQLEQEEQRQASQQREREINFLKRSDQN